MHNLQHLRQAPRQILFLSLCFINHKTFLNESVDNLVQLLKTCPKTQEKQSLLL